MLNILQIRNMTTETLVLYVHLSFNELLSNFGKHSEKPLSASYL